MVFTVIATTTIVKIPLIIVALVVITFRNPGTLQSPWRFLKLTKLSSLKVVQSWRDILIFGVKRALYHRRVCCYM